MENEKKKCSKCGNEFVLEDFPFKNTTKNIRHPICKTCWKEIRKKSYNQNKQVTLDRNKKNRKRNRDWYREYKSKLKCVKCDESHPACLEFHHSDPNIKESNVSMIISETSSIEKIMGEIDKCIVLCSNCHRKYHYEVD